MAIVGEGREAPPFAYSGDFDISFISITFAV